jgi:hypothetical protein
MLVPPPDIKYFDFRYPDATKMMIVTDEESSNGTETFNIMVPSDHPMYSRTWSHAIYNWSGNFTSGNIKIDDAELHSGSSPGVGWAIGEGDITPTQLFPDMFHEISLYHNECVAGASYVGIMLIYAEPQ